MTPGHIAESIKNIAKGIHEGSFKMRKTVQILIKVEQLASLHRQYMKPLLLRVILQEKFVILQGI